VVISDGFGETASDVFVIRVNTLPQEDGINGALPDVIILDQDTHLIQASDYFEELDGGDSLVYSLTKADGSDPESWISISSSSGQIIAAPTQYEAGYNYFKCIAEDEYGGQMSQSFSILVNGPPVVEETIPDLYATQDIIFAYTVQDGLFSDPEGNEVEITLRMQDLSAIPGWIDWDTQTMMLTGTPSSSDVNVLEMEVFGTDPYSETSNVI
jgi:hypothetical protein